MRINENRCFNTHEQYMLYLIVYSINPAITSLHNHFINNRYDGGVPQGPFLGHLEFTGVYVQKRDQTMKLKRSTLCVATVHI